MFKQAREITVGELVRDRGQSFTVREVRRNGGWIAFVDTEDMFHGRYAVDSERWTVGRRELKQLPMPRTKKQQINQILKLINQLPEESRERELRAIVRRSKFKLIRNDNLVTSQE